MHSSGILGSCAWRWTKCLTAIPLLLALLVLTGSDLLGQRVPPAPPLAAESQVTAVASTGFDASLTDTERAWLRAHPVVRVAQDDSWPPVEFVDENGEQSGFTNDYLRLVEARIGITFQRVRCKNWQEAYTRLKSWDIDMTTTVAETPGRLPFWSFTRPYMSIPIVLLTRSDVTYILGMRELAGKKVAVVDGYLACEMMARDYPDIQLVKVRSIKEGIELAQSGEVFALADNMMVISHYLAKMQVKSLKVSGETPYVNAQCMAVRKDWAVFAGILQKAMDSIPETTRAGLFSKWAPIRYEQGFDYALLVKVLASLLVLVAALGVWNWRLAVEIKQRKATEVALRESKEELSRYFDASLDMLCIADHSGRFLRLNPEWERALGYTVAELEGRLCLDFVHPDDQGKTSDALSRLARLEDISHFVNRYLHKDGSFRWIEWRSSAVGKLVYGTARDITERRRAEEEMQGLQAHLAQSQKMESLGSLASGVAHDMNNVLGAVLGLASANVNAQPPGSACRQALETIIKASEHGGQMVKSLLHFARQTVAEKQHVDLNEILKEEVRILERTILSDVRIELDLVSDLRPTVGDASALTHAVMNLCVNAVDAMPEKGILTFRTRNVDEEWIEVQVADTGVGMSKEVLARAMDPFYTTKEAGKGTGLGLSLVYSTVKAHGGKVEIQSHPGQGTSVRLRFPAHAPAVPAGQPVVPASPPASQLAQSVFNVLVVDDNDLIQTSTRMLLEALKHSVTVTHSGEEALQVLDAGLPADLVILDMNMPGLGGPGTLPRLRALRATLPVLLSTGRADQTALNLVESDPYTTLLPKPYSLKDLKNKIGAVIGT